METITIEKKVYERMKREIKSLQSTLEILQDEDMMQQIKESLRNIKRGKIWKSNY